jgi:hypothetical protein
MPDDQTVCMASTAYYEWVAAGRPLSPALPVRETVEQLQAAFPAAAAKSQFSWYADEAHYQAIPPQDHTPFSATGWPLSSPRWIVFATDVMHRPDLGVNCYALFNYWITEARAGRMPWMKYFIWQAKIYDVRNGWNAQTGSDHYDHVHLSMRTDWVNKGLGSWSITPRRGDDMIFAISDGPRKGAAGRAGGGTYEFADTGTQLEQWRRDQGGAGTVMVTEADIAAGRIGVEVKQLTTGALPGSAVTEAQVKAWIAATELLPPG